MPDVVVLALPAGPQFVDALQRVWDAGDAAFPLDLRLPPAERKRVLDTVSPAAVIEADGDRRILDGGTPVEPGDALVLATSGTTGLPKGVILTHDAVAASARATTKRIGVDPSRHTWLACLPLAHVGGLSVVTRALHTGTGLVVHDRFDADAVRDAVATDHVTHTSLVTKALNQIDPALFDTIVIGGAAPPANRPANVLATYGMTETGSGIVYDRAAIDGVELRLDHQGELHVRGPMLLRAYRTTSANRGNPNTVVDIDPLVDGWFATGDLGHWNDDGSLGIQGRKQEVIVTGGEKVWPARTETVLAELDDIADVAIVGVPHPDWGHEVVALLVASDPARPPELAHLREAISATLPVWYCPRRVVLVGEIPRTALGKVRRHELPPLVQR